jgi:hypothetical protein
MAEVLRSKEEELLGEQSETIFDFLNNKNLFAVIPRITYTRYRINNSNLWIDVFEKDNKVTFGEDFDLAPEINNVQLYNTKNIDFSDFLIKCPKQIAVKLLFFVHNF